MLGCLSTALLFKIKAYLFLTPTGFSMTNVQIKKLLKYKVRPLLALEQQNVSEFSVCFSRTDLARDGKKFTLLERVCKSCLQCD